MSPWFFNSINSPQTLQDLELKYFSFFKKHASLSLYDISKNHFFNKVELFRRSTIRKKVLSLLYVYPFIIDVLWLCAHDNTEANKKHLIHCDARVSLRLLAGAVWYGILITFSLASMCNGHPKMVKTKKQHVVHIIFTPYFTL